MHVARKPTQISCQNSGFCSELWKFDSSLPLAIHNDFQKTMKTLAPPKVICDPWPLPSADTILACTDAFMPNTVGPPPVCAGSTAKEINDKLMRCRVYEACTVRNASSPVSPV